MKNKITALVAAAVLTSCTAMTSNNTSKSTQLSLLNTQWSLADQVKGNIPTMQFQQLKIAGNAGCNNYFGEISWNETSGSFSASNIGATEKACMNMDAENNFLRLLPQVTSYRVKGNTLELYKGELLLLKFNRVN